MPVEKRFAPNPARRLLAAVPLLALAAVVVLLLLPAGRRPAQEIESVLVANFPELQRVEGEVEVAGIVRHARLDRRGEVLVPPVEPASYTQLIDGGAVSTDGFTRVVLSLAGEVKGRAVKTGQVGAILIPDEEPVRQAFDEEGRFHFALKVSAPVPAATTFVASDPVELTVAFPRYRVLLYNTSDRTVGVHLFSYLTN